MADGWSGGMDGWTAAVALIITSLLLLYWYSVSAFSQLEQMGIPHPKPAPFIGNLLLFHKGFWEGAADIIRRYGPITGYYMGRRPIVLLSDPDAIRQVTQADFANFPNRAKLSGALKVLSDTLLGLRDRRWERVRSALTPTLSAARAKEIAPLIGQACEDLLGDLQRYADSGEPCNIYRSYACYTLDLVASVAFGTSVVSQKDPDHPLVQNCKSFLELFSPSKPLLLLTLAFPSIMLPIARHLPSKSRHRITNFFRNTVQEMIAMRDRQPANERRRDYLQLLLDARAWTGEVSLDHFDMVNQSDLESPQAESQETPRKTPKKTLDEEEILRWKTPKKTLDEEEILRRKTPKKTLDEEEILGQTLIFVIAGYENTLSLLSFTSYLLATHPQCQEKLLAELDRAAQTQDGDECSTVADLPYLDMVIAESLRMYPPAYRFAREAARDCTVMGRRIPAGTVIEIPVSCVQNDPQHWPEPERFRPERFSAEEKRTRHPFTYLPFGAGPRSCIGVRLGILKAKISLFRILRKVRFETCPLTQIPLQCTAEATLRPRGGVYLKVVAR